MLLVLVFWGFGSWFSGLSESLLRLAASHVPIVIVIVMETAGPTMTMTMGGDGGGDEKREPPPPKRYSRARW